MKIFHRIFVLSLTGLLFFSASKAPEDGSEPKVKRVQLDYIQKIMAADDDTLYIINFWATWCKPCIEEMPYFEKINEKYANQKVKVILVSVDYPKHYESRLLPFVKKHDLQSEVVLLDVKDPNDWIPAISSEWKGSIPATLMIYPDEELIRFYETEFSYEELEEIVESLI